MNKNIFKEFFESMFTFKRGKVKNDYLTLSEDALRYYKKNVKDNGDITLDQARRKMTRNMALAFPYRRDPETKKNPRVWYAYGCLRFIVKNGEVTWMLNKQPVFKSWFKDYEKYKVLNKEFNIVE